jgi:hypothetical protein
VTNLAPAEIVKAIHLSRMTVGASLPFLTALATAVARGWLTHV